MRNFRFVSALVVLFAFSIASPKAADKPSSNGIFVAKGETLVSISVTPVTDEQSASMKGMMKAGWGGTAEVKRKLPGSRAEVRVAPNAEFIFSGADFTPDKYVLVKLTSKRDEREFIGGTGKRSGMMSRGVKIHESVPEKYVLPVTVQVVSDGTHKVVSTKPLEVGEYAFIAEGINIVYAFGVDK